FSDKKVLEAMLLGDVQLAAPSLSKFGKYTKVLQVFDLPFLFKDMDAVERFQSGEKGQMMLKSLESKGLIGLGYLHNGMKQLSANNALLTPEDASGRKFRIMSSNVLKAQFEAVEAVPLKKPYSEVFTLLQTNAIDGQENTWSNIYSKKFFEVQDHITNSNHGLLDYMLVTSAEFWNGLDDGLRTEIKKALDEAVKVGNVAAAEKSQSDMKRIMESGRTTVHELTKKQRDQWVAAMKPVWNQFAEEIGQEVIDAAVASNN
ncbi:MAG: DctP family TRAP transporter solute-binding subunit, partial [Rhizobiales bacterium]|nr:DctP family TRAP transporter solute-binding subunit [Hyphomicrobiales bacterium]